MLGPSSVLIALLLAAVAAAMAMLAYVYIGVLGLLIFAIICGGIGGGFTLALVGGENYGLRMPRRVPGGTTPDGNPEKIDPGCFGELFVGLMAGLLGVAVACRTLKIEMFKPSDADPLVQLFFVDFGIAYVSGFLGLRLIRAVSERFLYDTVKAQGQDLKEVAREQKFQSAQDAFREKQYDVAEHLFREQIQADGSTTIRGFIGLGRTLKRLGRFGDAIAVVDEAIRIRDREELPGRVAVAYWNRACYKALSSGDVEHDIDEIIADLQEALKIQPSYKLDLLSEEDLAKVREHPKFKALVERR
jgi:tetratricopeptide (TPR) repeat protein